MKSFLKNSYLAIIFLLLYTPILILMLFSFNGGNSVRSWNYWSWEGYRDLFQQNELWEAVSVTLIVAFISTFVAVIIGTFAALGLSKTKKITRNLTLGITNIPLINADIVTAVSLMLLFMALGFSFGLGTLILAHISFNIPYVIITVLPKIRSINMAELEASQDLGATPWYTLRKIVLPTIKPAIIAGAAIAFAMSFDDFLISYFTGGNTSNVSTFIYSLKRIKPYINAFSTIIILLIAIIIISWNSYIVIKKQIKQRNEKIAKGIYHDKKIIKTEKLLTKYYLQLNSFNLKKIKGKNKEQKSPYDNNFEIVTAQDIIKTEAYIKNHPKLIAQISKLEAKLEMESIWIQHIKNKIKKQKELKEERSKLRREKYRFLLWPWKLIMITIILMSSFISLGALYIYTNFYDLSIANWGDYINPNVLKGFENKYQVKIKYSTFDDNESLYAKLYTTNYDLMVPSDYMVAKLANEDTLFPIATTDNANVIHYDSRLDFNPITAISPTLYQLMNNYQVENADGTFSKNGLNNYSIPYFWGDVVLVINTTNPNNLSDLNINNADGSDAQWNILTTAAKLQKHIVLNDDMHNLFMTALTDLHYKDKWQENNGTGNYNQVKNTFHDNINAHNSVEINDTSNWLLPVINNKNTKLLNDDIVDEIKKTNNWDIAMMYNGDLLAAINDNPNFYNGKYLAIRPYMGTNVWIDSMVISKNSSHKDLAFKFINYIMQKQTQIALSEFGYTSPLQAAIDEISILYPDEIWKHVYIPNDGQLPDPLDKTSHPQGYFNGLYTHGFDPEMQTAYNKLLAR